MRGEIQKIASAIRYPFNLLSYPTPSSFQNAAETIAVLCGLASLALCGYRHITIRLRGDSLTVLSWFSGDHQRHGCHSTRARGAAIALVALCQSFDFRFDKTYLFIPSEANSFCDSMSRGDFSALTSLPPSVGVIQQNTFIESLLTWSDPTVLPSSDHQFLDTWNDITRLCATIA
jgi:hypothetical protein